MGDSLKRNKQSVFQMMSALATTMPVRAFSWQSGDVTERPRSVSSAPAARAFRWSASRDRYYASDSCVIES